MENYSRRTDEKMEIYSRNADDMLEKFLQITSSVGIQLQGMNSSIVKMKEEEEDDRCKHFNERITNIEKSLIWMKNTNIEVKNPKEQMWIRIKAKQW